MYDKIPNLIRWTRSDYARLSHAVREFNKTIAELEKLNKNYLPEGFNYKELRDSIYSRSELNRIIKSLKRFTANTKEQAIVTIPSGEEISKWEYKELKKAMRRATLRITDQARKIIDDDRNVIGDVEFKRLLRTKESIEDLFNRSGSEFKRTRGRTLAWGKKDFELYRADIFRQSYMKALEEMSSYKNYDLLVKELEGIKNPVEFYNYISKSEILKDLFLFYKDKATSQTYGGFVDNQEAFDTALFEQLGIEREM